MSDKDHTFRLPPCPSSLDWGPKITPDLRGGTTIHRKMIGKREQLWAICNAWRTSRKFNMQVHAPVFLQRVDAHQLLVGLATPSYASPLPSACINASLILLNVIETRQLAYEGDADPVINFRQIIQTTAWAYDVDPSEMMAQYPKIRQFLSMPNFKPPMDIEAAIRGKAGDDYIDGRT